MIVLIPLSFWLFSLPIDDIGPSRPSLSHSRPIRKTPLMTKEILSTRPVELPAKPQTSKPALNRSNHAQQHLDQSGESELARIIDMIDEGNWSQAEKLLKQLAATDPENELVLLELAMIQLVDKRDPHAAKPYLKKAALVKPDSHQVISELISVYGDTNSLEEGIKFLKEMPYGDSGAVNFGIGSALLSRGNAQEAIEYLERALERGVDDVESAQEEVAEAYLGSGQVDEAMQMWNSLIQSSQDPERRRELTLRKASVLKAQGNIQDSLDIMRDYILNHPDDRYAHEFMEGLKSDKG